MAVYAPIWKDTYYNVSSAQSPYEYTIELETGRQITQTINGVTTTVNEIATVFNGKAWVRPGEPYIQVNINKIAQDYLTSDLPDLRNITANTSYVHNEAYRIFYLKTGAGVAQQTYYFLLDWSYVDKSFSSSFTMGTPINGHGCNGMFFLGTMFNSSSGKVVTSINLSPGSSYDNTHCGDYAIYYLTRSGGWCSFLIEGNVVKSDTYNKYNISVPFDNTKPEFQKKTYHNEISTKYEMYTGWLSDEQAANLAENLLGTNKAYLHDLKTGEIIPVLSTVGTAIYKTFKNQGNKKVNYALTLECSQTKHNVS